MENEGNTYCRCERVHERGNPVTLHQRYPENEIATSACGGFAMTRTER